MAWENLVDWQVKSLHVAIAEEATKEGGRTFHNALVFNPAQIYSKVNEQSEDLYREFFTSGKTFRLVSMETRMGPGECAKVFAEKFGARCPMAIGGIIAFFEIEPGRLEELWVDITKNTDSYKESAEQKAFT